MVLVPSMKTERPGRMSFAIADTVGPYRILEELGRGAAGRVFKVEHNITQRLEAMKVLERGRPDAPELAERSLREIRLQARMDHPNIAAIHNAFWAGEDLVLVMELIEGCSLRRLLEAGRIPLPAAIDYACQALSALAYAHARGVIHRDISPSNMIVGSDGPLKLSDFGLAKGPADVRVSQNGAPLGSLYYMSPEQVRGLSQVDARSDIYSLGAVLYELVTGRKPFDGESAYSIMVEQVEKQPAPPIEVEPGLPEPLNDIILRALEKDPSRRFSSADEFRELLMQIGEHASPPRPSVLRWRGAGALGAVILAASLILVGSRPVPVMAPATVVAPAPTEPTPPAAAVTSKARPRQASQAAGPQKPNRIKRALGKLWRLAPHKKSS
jgi:serine/threonine protein kinase